MRRKLFTLAVASAAVLSGAGCVGVVWLMGTRLVVYFGSRPQFCLACQQNRLELAIVDPPCVIVKLPGIMVATVAFVLPAWAMRYAAAAWLSPLAVRWMERRRL